VKKNASTGVIKETTSYDERISLPQITWSEGHPISLIEEKKNDLLLDIGGPFLTGRLIIRNPAEVQRSHLATGGNPANTYVYSGPVLGAAFDELRAYDQTPQTSNKDFSYAKTLKLFEDLSSTSFLEAKGSTAIARSRPTQQQAGIFVTLRETYNDGLPKVPGVSRERVRSALRDYREKKASGVVKGPAEEYLNVVFGVLPLLADARSIHSSIKNFEKNVDQFKANAGKLVRRRYEFPTERTLVTVAEEQRTAGWPGAYTNTNVFSNQVLRPHNHYKEVERRTSFSGAFTYFLNDSESYFEEFRKLNSEADYLFGAGLTLENLWNSSPWTWLIDWYTNAGDILANFSSMMVDNLVLRYGYITERTIARHNCDSSIISAKQSGLTSKPVTRNLYWNVEATQRLRATPFGFGLSDSDLSVKQKLILAALGITRV